MTTTLILQTLATALGVGATLWLLRRGGPRIGGLAAAFPVTSAPTLFWLSLDKDAHFAVQAAVAALVATGLTPVLVTVYGRASLRRGPGFSLLIALPPTAALALWVQQPLVGSLVAALLFAAASTLLAQRLLPKPALAAPRQSVWRRELLLSMGVAASMTLLIGLFSHCLTAAACGLITAVPLVGLCTLMTTHRQQGSATCCRFLLGYLDGMLAKTAFLAMLALALTSLPLAAAWLLALAGGLLTLMLTLALKPALSSLRLFMQRWADLRRSKQVFALSVARSAHDVHAASGASLNGLSPLPRPTGH